MTALHLGLTGGMGSGKSTVAALLAGRGASVLDADAISRAATAASGSAIAAISERFGAGMIDAGGALDRTAMRTLVYADAGARAALEAIVHPLVQSEMEHQARQALQAGARLLVYDIPLLAEGGTRWRSRLDRVLVVDCEPETQVSRITGRDGLSAAAAQRIIAAQAARAERLAVADMVVFNGRDVTLGKLRNQIDTLLRQLQL